MKTLSVLTRFTPFLATVFLLFGSNSVIAASYADLPDLSLLTPYATYGKIYSDSNVTIDGDVAISNNGKLTLQAPCTINGNLYLGVGATNEGPGTITGSRTTNVDFSAAQDQLFQASTTLKTLQADYTKGDVTSGMTFAAQGPVTVIDMMSLNLSKGEDILFSGSPTDYFILNISGKMALSGDATIGTSLYTSRVILNLYDTGSLGTVAKKGTVINATTLVPYATATFHSVNGAIYSGNQNITLMSDATVNHLPYAPPVPSPVPIPGIPILLGSGLAVVAMCRKKSRN